MKYSTVYVGMDVHKDSFSLCCYTNEKEKAEFPQKVDGHYSKVINYIEARCKSHLYGKQQREMFFLRRFEILTSAQALD